MLKKSLNVFFIVLLLVSLLSACATDVSENAGTVVAYVGEEAIYEQELDYFSARLRAQVINDYAQEYSAEYSDGFWSESFSGTTPADTLRGLAMTECIRAKTVLILCRDNGIYDDISFDGLKKSAESYNSENENKSGKVGLNSISISQFYTYYVENGALELKNRLADSVLAPDSECISMAKDALGDNAPESAVHDRAVDINFEEYIDELITDADVIVVTGTAD